jgi:translation elongation factor P/translation initiation factor 5A
MDNFYTAAELKSFLNKKAFYYEDYDNPVIPISCDTYKTGKHGCGKTTLSLKDYFSEKIFTTILDSDEKFYNFEQSVCYETRKGLLTRLKSYDFSDSNSLAVVLDQETYEELEIPMSSRALKKVLGVLNLPSHVKHIADEDLFDYGLLSYYVVWSNKGQISYKILDVQTSESNK